MISCEEFNRAVQLVGLIYEKHPCGGDLHIVLDDGNLERGHIEYCWKVVCNNENESEDELIAIEKELIKLLAKMNYVERSYLYDMDDFGESFDEDDWAPFQLTEQENK